MWSYLRTLSLFVVFTGLCAYLMAAFSPQSSGTNNGQERKRPKLAVLVVFDQMRGDYPQKWRELFSSGGFARVEKEGVWFTNCHYPYANTMTAAGHASMVTGCPPAEHGIVANSWYDRSKRDSLAAISDDEFPIVTTTGVGKSGAAPTRRLQQSIGDALMEQTNGKAKVVSISIKDRAAILMAALRSLLCLWVDSNTGQAITSRFYTGELPTWVRKYNQQKPADALFGKTWSRLRADLDYKKFSGEDDFPYEGVGIKQGRTFPHDLTGGLKEPGPKFYNAMANSPYGNELILNLAREAILREKLGQDDTPDLLCLGFSSNDYVGHCWGPDSQEVLDMTLRSDLILESLLQFLDQEIGRGEYVVVVCSDHGVCPLPEFRKAAGKNGGGRIAPKSLTSGAQKFLNDTFGKGKDHPWIEDVSSGMIYLNQGTLKEMNLESAEVEKALCDWFSKQEGIQACFSRSEMLTSRSFADPVKQMVRNSFHPQNSGDVLPVLEPYYLLSDPLTPGKTGSYTTTHGTPHDYDTHVPLMVFGAVLKPGQRDDRVTPLAVAPILAEALSIRPPSGCTTPVPTGLYGQRK